MKKKTNTTRWICLEGAEGTYKTTTARVLAERLQGMGYHVLETKEPGTAVLPITMELRRIALEDTGQVNHRARSLLMAAIREIHKAELIDKKGHEYDYIIQDRGILSGWVYEKSVQSHFEVDTHIPRLDDMKYDKIVILKNSSTNTLSIAQQAKKEFTGGDSIENLGVNFHETVACWFDELSLEDRIRQIPILSLEVAGKSTDQIVSNILDSEDVS